MAFINFKNEAEATQKGALWAIILITCALALLSVGGAIATSSGDGLTWFLRIFFAACVVGAEALAAFALTRVMLAPNRFRKVVGSIIFVGLAWVCVQNSKNGVHFIYPDRFAASSAELSAKAQLAAEEAATLGTAAQDALANSGKELERVRTEIADLQAFLLKMSAQTVEGVKEAQSEMIGRCGYSGRVDGIRSVLTESAMRVCGERINNQLGVLRQRETNLLSGAASPVQTASTGKRIEQIETQSKAEAAFWAGIWLEVMLWVLEGARSLGLWVFVMSATAQSHNRLRDLTDQIEVAKLEAELARVKKGPEPEPEPVDKQPAGENPGIAPSLPSEPQPHGPSSEAVEEHLEAVDEFLTSDDPIPDEPTERVEEEELTPAQRRARKGGQAAQLYRRAEKNQKKIPVSDDRSDDEMFSDKHEQDAA